MLADGGGGGFQGIDPSVLAQLMKSLSSGVSGAQPAASSYVSQFSRLGLDTGAVQKLLADYAWASAQRPMLSRRLSLASHQPSGAFTDGWTAEGAGPLLYPTTAAAKAAGTADAKRMQGYLNERDWTGVQKELSAMAQSEGDADYMAAFFSRLGPAGLYGLSLYARGGNSNADDQEVQQIVGNGLATASFEMPLTRKFLQGIAPGEPPAGYSTEQLPGGWDTSALAPFLTEGAFSKQWLQTISPAVLYLGGAPMMTPVPPGYNAIFQAIASNPDYAAEFYQQNSNQLNNYMVTPTLYHYLASGPGFGQFLEAATVPPPGATDTAPFTQNATAFVKLFGDSGADTSPTVRQAMAAVTAAYFNDLVGTVTAAAPVPGAGSTMGLTAQEWGMFVQDAMEDKTSAAYLLTLYANWRGPQLQSPDDLAGSGAGDGPDTPYHAGYWHDQSYGALDYFFASNYQAAGAKAGSSSNSVTQILTDALDAGGATLLTSVLFGPEAGAVELLGDAGEDAFSQATESALGKLTEPLAEGGDAGAGPGADNLAGDLSSAQARWAQAVDTAWGASGSTPGHVNQKDFPAQSYNGMPYNGDPLPYERQYGGYFMNPDGSIKPAGEIAQDPKALAAYNAWLQDPAISNVVAGDFSDESQGLFNGIAAAQLGSG